MLVVGPEIVISSVIVRLLTLNSPERKCMLLDGRISGGGQQQLKKSKDSLRAKFRLRIDSRLAANKSKGKRKGHDLCMVEMLRPCTVKKSSRVGRLVTCCKCWFFGAEKGFAKRLVLENLCPVIARSGLGGAVSVRNGHVMSFACCRCGVLRLRRLTRCTSVAVLNYLRLPFRCKTRC